MHSPNMSLHENSCELCSFEATVDMLKHKLQQHAVDGQDSKTSLQSAAGDYLDDAKHGFGKFTWPNMNARGLSLRNVEPWYVSGC